MQWQWLIGPLMGAIIGYITNDIAVRMMFRPHRALHIFGFHIPFTPGLIPKGRPRLSRAIRDVLDQELLSQEVLAETLLSEKMLDKIGDAADGAMGSLLAEERTPRMLLEGMIGEESLTSFEAKAKRAAGIFLMEKLLDSGIERIAAEAVMEEAKKRVSSSPAAILTVFLDDKRTASMQDKLALALREMLATHTPAAVDNMLDSIASEGLDTPIGTLAKQYGDGLTGTRDFARTQYAALIRKGLPTALSALDLGAIVEDKLNSLSMDELETLILQLMKKELRAIVWLGGLLGAIMGTVNTIVSVLF